MDKNMRKIAEEIAALREEQGMTFKAIGELYQISPGKAFYLYQDFLRRRRLARVYELYEEQNQIEVSIRMTLGEVVVLQRVLTFYQTWALRENSRRAREENPVFKEPDYVTAEYLNNRLAKLEKEKRKAVQGNKDLSAKPIDFSTFC